MRHYWLYGVTSVLCSIHVVCCQALHLVGRARKKQLVPVTLPVELIPPSKRKLSSSSSTVTGTSSSKNTTTTVHQRCSLASSVSNWSVLPWSTLTNSSHIGLVHLLLCQKVKWAIALHGKPIVNYRSDHAVFSAMSHKWTTQWWHRLVFLHIYSC